MNNGTNIKEGPSSFSLLVSLFLLPFPLWSVCFQLGFGWSWGKGYKEMYKIQISWSFGFSGPGEFQTIWGEGGWRESGVRQLSKKQNDSICL